MLHCKQCKFVKGDDQFYTSNQSTCKECIKANARANRRKRIDYYRAYDRERGNRQGLEYLRSYRKSNAAKYKAHCMVNNAIRDGKLLKESCEICDDENVHAHHDDYLKPLEVRWLCPAHHHQWHAQHGEAKNANATEEEFWEAVKLQRAS